ncbi:MAG: MFS transporter, partial [Limisphaerales bacterium]
PAEMRGRVSAVNNLFMCTSNELGGTESGRGSHFFGPIFAVVSGGIGTIIAVGAIALAWPQIRKYGRLGSEKVEN